MRSVAVHAALLLVALLVAYQTWTREETEGERSRPVVVMDGELEDFRAVRWATETKTLTVERREEGDESYLWGTEVRRVAGALADSGPAGTPLLADTAEFPVGRDGDELVGLLAPLRALRDMGTVDEGQRVAYGLADTAYYGVLTVELGDRTREFRVGSAVYGGGDRYTAETGGERVWVLPSLIFQKVEGGEGILRERQLHAFALTDVSRVRISTEGGERERVRRRGERPGVLLWTPADAPGETDQTFANFVERVEQLWITRYLPEISLDALTRILRVDYSGEEGAPLGYLELYRDAAEPGQAPTYVLRTEKTRVPGEAAQAVADRVSEDVRQLF